MSGRWPEGAGALTARVEGRTYLTAEGAARVLGVPVAFVRRAARRGPWENGVGLVPCGASSGKRYLFTREAVRRFGNDEPMPWLGLWRKMEREREEGADGGE